MTEVDHRLARVDYPERRDAIWATDPDRPRTAVCTCGDSAQVRSYDAAVTWAGHHRDLAARTAGTRRDLTDLLARRGLHVVDLANLHGSKS